MVASISVFEDEIGEFIFALFDANIQQFSNQKKIQIRVCPPLKRVVKKELQKIF